VEDDRQPAPTGQRLREGRAAHHNAGPAHPVASAEENNSGPLRSPSASAGEPAVGPLVAREKVSCFFFFLFFFLFFVYLFSKKYLK
jgi:hypothetical protein